MITLTEQAIIAEFTGKPITEDPLPSWVWKRGNGYIIYCASHLADDKSLRAQFGITEKLKDSWHRRGNELDIHLAISDGRITSIDIDKYNNGEGARPSGDGPRKTTPQELRLVIRLLKHITQ
ncbi:MAG: hypothetical protein IKW20_01630 [Bacteroidales bacterium]|nr:hypothetical protein [Bacteroidales bacterium]